MPKPKKAYHEANDNTKQRNDSIMMPKLVINSKGRSETLLLEQKY